MVLSFKSQFVEKINSGSKIHTIREDPKRRWQNGKKIHFATGVRTANYNCFKESVCISNQAVSLDPSTKQIYLGLNGQMNLLASTHHELFAKNDGFDLESDFWKWFNEPFSGVVVHWTDFIYS